jgi:hypothetical protein
MIQARLNGQQREFRIVFAPRQALFLHGGDGQAIDDQGGGGVMIVSRDSEYVHPSPPCS